MTSCTRRELNIQHQQDRQPIDITFQDMNYSIQIGSQIQKKGIINNANGVFRGAEVNIIMGPSGCGKSTLLNLISYKIQDQETKAKVYANHQPITYTNFGCIAKYVMQNDYLMPTLTVRQTLRFAIDLKMQGSEEQKKIVIDNMIKKLKLQSCADTLIGNKLIKGISGGEKRRTSIAFELISDPDVILLDEPTSGLDSLTSYVIMQYLRDLAHLQHKTIIATIHQPNSQIFSLFDNLFLMVEGHIIYQGKANESISYFQTNFDLKCPQWYNPADYIMSIVHQEAEQNKKRTPLYIQHYKTHCEQQITLRIASRRKTHVQFKETSTSFGNELRVLIKRQFLKIVRNPMMIKSRFVQVIILFVYVGGLYIQMDHNYSNRKAWVSLQGFGFFLSLNGVFMSLMPIVLIFATEREVFLKEQNSKLYGITSYFMSKNIIQVPYSFVFPLLQCLILYWFVGLSNTPQQFFIFLLTIFLLNFSGISLGLLVASLASDANRAMAYSIFLLLPLSYFSGLFKNSNNLPPWIGWIQYVTPFKYAFIVLVENEIGGESAGVAELGFNVSLWSSIVILGCLGIIYRLIGLFCLSRLKNSIQ